MAQVGHGWSVENIGYTLGTPKIHWSSINLPVRIAILGYYILYIYTPSIYRFLWANQFTDFHSSLDKFLIFDS